MSGMILTKNLKCYICSALIEEISGGFHNPGYFGINLISKLKWSDGKKYKTFSDLVGSTSFLNPELIKCYNCKELLWRTDLEKIMNNSIYDLNKNKSILDNTQKYIVPSCDDYIKFAESTTKKEYIKHCRIEAWHIDNDKRRNKKYKPLNEKEIDNLLKLSEILSDKNDCLIKVEVYRELGEFDKSLKVLTSNYSKEEDDYNLFYTLNILKIKELVVYGEKSIKLR